LRKTEPAALIQRSLAELYPETPVPLDHRDPFTLLVAVLLSAQCTDQKGNEVTPALFAPGPDPAAMAALDEATILGHIRQLGLARTKAKHVKRLADLLLERHGGELPQSFQALEALPHSGHPQHGHRSGGHAELQGAAGSHLAAVPLEDHAIFEIGKVGRSVALEFRQGSAAVKEEILEAEILSRLAGLKQQLAVGVDGVVEGAVVEVEEHLLDR